MADNGKAAKRKERGNVPSPPELAPLKLPQVEHLVDSHPYSDSEVGSSSTARRTATQKFLDRVDSQRVGLQLLEKTNPLAHRGRGYYDKDGHFYGGSIGLAEERLKHPPVSSRTQTDRHPVVESGVETPRAHWSAVEGDRVVFPSSDSAVDATSAPPPLLPAVPANVHDGASRDSNGNPVVPSHARSTATSTAIPFAPVGTIAPRPLTMGVNPVRTPLGAPNGTQPTAPVEVSIVTPHRRGQDEVPIPYVLDERTGKTSIDQRELQARRETVTESRPPDPVNPMAQILRLLQLNKERYQAKQSDKEKRKVFNDQLGSRMYRPDVDAMRRRYGLI